MYVYMYRREFLYMYEVYTQGKHAPHSYGSFSIPQSHSERMVVALLQHFPATSMAAARGLG